MNEKTINSDFLTEVKKQAASCNFELPGAWNAVDSAAVVVRTLAVLFGQKEILADDEYGRNERKEAVAAILPIFEAGAPVNFRRGFLVAQGLAPKMAERKEAGGKLI